MCIKEQKIISKTEVQVIRTNNSVDCVYIHKHSKHSIYVKLNI